MALVAESTPPVMWDYGATYGATGFQMAQKKVLTVNQISQLLLENESDEDDDNLGSLSVNDDDEEDDGPEEFEEVISEPPIVLTPPPPTPPPPGISPEPQDISGELPSPAASPATAKRQFSQPSEHQNSSPASREPPAKRRRLQKPSSGKKVCCVS